MLRDRKHYVLLLKIILWAGIGWYVFRYLNNNWSRLTLVDVHVGWPGIALFVTATCVGNIALWATWSRFLYQLSGVQITARYGMRLSAIAWMSRYVPGKVWAVAGKVYYSTPTKEKTQAVIVAALLEAILVHACGLTLALCVLPYYSENHIISAPLLYFLPLVPIGLLLGIHPRFFCPVINALFRLIRRPQLDHAPRYGNMLKIMFVYTIVYLIWSLAFVALASSMMAVTIGNAPFLVAIFAISWIVGFFSLLAPAGIGVRDAILLGGLAYVHPDSPSVVLAIVIFARVLSVASDLLSLAAVLLFTCRINLGKQAEPARQAS